MKKILLIITLVFTAGEVLLSFTKSHLSTGKLPVKMTSLFEPVAVVELFTSQGCSSCPPADKLLSQTINSKNDKKIFALSYHVDYWNRLGWADPFSSAGFSNRQNKYVQALNIDGAYTPQIIVNGNREFVGSDRGALTKALNNALNTKAAVHFMKLEALQLPDNAIRIHYTAEGDLTNASINFALVSLAETTSIKRGENSGATLTSENIVRQLISEKAKEKGEATFAFTPMPAKGNLGVIVFVQQEESFNIIGGAMVNF